VRYATLRAAAETLCESLRIETFHGGTEERTSEARCTLGEEAFASAWESGRAMTLDQAIAIAMEDSAEARRPLVG
jgi:hypothetical protein